MDVKPAPDKCTDEWVVSRFGNEVFQTFQSLRSDPDQEGQDDFELLEMARQQVYAPIIEEYMAVGEIPCNMREAPGHVEILDG